MRPAVGLHKQRRRGSRLPVGAVVVDRTSRRGNPFTVEQILSDGDADSAPAARVLAVRRYTNWLDGRGPSQLPVTKTRLVDRDWINANMDELIGVDLACTCPVDGLPCHRDVLLARAAERALYRERAHLLAWDAAVWPAELRIDPDGPPAAAAVLYLDTPAGQVSWHVAANDLDLFGHVQRADPNSPDSWDRHTTEEKYQRIRDLTAQLANEKGTPDMISNQPDLVRSELVTVPANDRRICEYSKAAYNHLVEAQHELNQAMAAFARMLDRSNELGSTYDGSDDAQQIAQLVEEIAPNLRKATELVAAAPRTTALLAGREVSAPSGIVNINNTERDYR